MLTVYNIVPSTVDFERALLTGNLYANIALCKYLLMDIENGDCKETLNSDTLTIEHIMPQTLNAEWKHISDEEHEQYLHTLGNLSVSGYNSELSNKNFIEKKKIIAENSKAIVLNSDVWDKDNWTIEDIKNRSQRLANILLERYKIDKVNDETIEFDIVNTITLDDYDDVTGKKLVSFKFEDDTYRQNKYALMLLEVIRLLDKKKPGILKQLAEKDFSFNLRNRHKHLSLSDEDMRWAWCINEEQGIYMEANLSAHSVMKFIESLMEQYDIDKKSFSISVIAEENIEDDNDEE